MRYLAPTTFSMCALQLSECTDLAVFSQLDLAGRDWVDGVVTNGTVWSHYDTWPDSYLDLKRWGLDVRQSVLVETLFKTLFVCCVPPPCCLLYLVAYLVDRTSGCRWHQ